MAEKITKEDVIEFISNMTVLELSELVKELEDKFGVKASAPVMAMAGPLPRAGRSAAVQEDKRSFPSSSPGWGTKRSR